MIIKIKMAEKSDGWFLYDNAQGIAYSRHPDIRLFFEDSMGQDIPYNVVAYTDESLSRTQGSFFNSIPIAPGTPEPGWYITFLKEAESFEFWGDTEIYLLSDNGKTVERIF